MSDEAEQMVASALAGAHTETLALLGAVTIIWLPEDVLSLWGDDEDDPPGGKDFPRPTYAEAKAALDELKETLVNHAIDGGWAILRGSARYAVLAVRAKGVATSG